MSDQKQKLQTNSQFISNPQQLQLCIELIQSIYHEVQISIQNQPSKVTNSYKTKLTTHKQYRVSNKNRMKTKKKPTTPKPPNPIKLLNIKTLEPQKNTASTSEKTYMTIEQNIRTLQNTQPEGKRQSFKTRFSFNKKSCHQRMEQHNLSPFSNDGRSSSPKYRKTPQKLHTPRQQKQVKFTINLKQLQKKKAPKSKVNSARQTYNNKKSILINKTVANNMTEHKKKPLNKKKKSQKTQKQQKARIQFQNEFLSMMNNRIHKQKITEISDEQLEGSIRRKPKLQICIQSDNSSREDQKLREKKQIVKTMKLKVMKNIQRDYPNLDPSQKKVIGAVIIIQRLWRQRKVKQFFQHYVTPKASPQNSLRQSLQNQISNNNSTINLLTSHIVKKSKQYKSCDAVAKLPKKKSSLPQKFPQNFLIRQNSQDSCKEPQKIQTKCQKLSVRMQSKLNDKVTQLFEDSILPFENQNQKIIKESSNLDSPSIIKFVECYRQIKLSNPKKQTKSKRNIFSLKQSLSEKCLMQKYYTRIFSDKPQKDKPKNYELFSLSSRRVNESLKQNQQSSIQLFKEINKQADQFSSQDNVRKQEQEEVWLRNDTHYSQQTDSDQLLNSRKDIEIDTQKLIVDQILVDQILHLQSFCKQSQQTQIKVEVQEEAKQIPPRSQPTEKQESCGIVVNQRNKIQQKPQFSLKSIQKVSQQLITELMNQFFKEYVGFQQKQCLVKKHRSSRSKEEQRQKKPRLPGIQITHKSITQYLDILIPYILDQDRREVLRSLELFQPSTYQKCHRVDSLVYELFEFADEEEEDDIYWNIISNEGFFLCLQVYWQKNVTLTKENQKFTNFLDLTHKVYNRCITDAFSQIFNKQVLQRIVYPWNKLTTKLNTINFSKQLHSIMNAQMIQTIAQEVKQKLLRQSFCYSTTEGRLVKKDRKQKLPQTQYEFGIVADEERIVQKLSDEQFTKVMKIADEEFLQDEKELMYCVDQRYELKGDLGETIFDQLIRQLQSQILLLEQSRTVEQLPLSKSQNQIFLQTNQTLQTNCYF